MKIYFIKENKYIETNNKRAIDRYKRYPDLFRIIENKQTETKKERTIEEKENKKLK